jgi:hypothetical protein
MMDDRHDEVRLAELLQMLPPAPTAWVQAAQERPAAARAIDQILALAETDADFRRALVADLEAALRAAGHEPDPQVVRGLRSRLPRR